MKLLKNRKQSEGVPSQKTVFTNGVFDIIHKGHIDMLRFAGSLGNKLVVAINSDSSTRTLKGPERPINNERERKSFLERLGFIDEVIIFDDLTPTKTIIQLQPQIVVKGNEWPTEVVRRKDGIPEHIEIVLAPLTINPEDSKKYSTSEIIKKIKGGKK